MLITPANNKPKPTNRSMDTKLLPHCAWPQYEHFPLIIVLGKEQLLQTTMARLGDWGAWPSSANGRSGRVAKPALNADFKRSGMAVLAKTAVTLGFFTRASHMTTC
jgi:hypothetical protein